MRFLLAVSFMITFVVAATCQKSWAEDVASANYIMPGCKAIISQSPDLEVAFKAGNCGGMISAIEDLSIFLPPSINYCSPNGVTKGQLLRVAVKYIDDQPARQMSRSQH
jgi:hypothetical protein